MYSNFRKSTLYCDWLKGNFRWIWLGCCAFFRLKRINFEWGLKICRHWTLGNSEPKLPVVKKRNNQIDYIKWNLEARFLGIYLRMNYSWDQAHSTPTIRALLDPRHEESALIPGGANDMDLSTYFGYYPNSLIKIEKGSLELHIIYSPFFFSIHFTSK